MPNNIGNFTRIPMYYQLDMNKDFISEAYSSAAKSQTAVSSAVGVFSFDELGNKTLSTLNLANNSSMVSQYKENVDKTELRLSKMQLSIDRLNDIIDEVYTRIVSARDQANVDEQFPLFCENKLKEIQSLLNVKGPEDDYLFSGFYQGQSVDLSTILAMMTPDLTNSTVVQGLIAPDTSWYLGTSDVRSVVIDENNISLDWGTTANEPGIEKLIRVLKIGKITPQNNSNESKQMMEYAIRFIGEAAQEFKDGPLYDIYASVAVIKEKSDALQNLTSSINQKLDEILTPSTADKMLDVAKDTTRYQIAMSMAVQILKTQQQSLLNLFV